MHLITLFRVMNPHQRCLQATVKYQNEPKQVMSKSTDLSRSLEIKPMWTFDTEFITIFNKSCIYITFKSTVMPGLHLQRNRRKSVIQKIYDGRGNFNDGCVASGARLLRRLRCSTLTTGQS